MTLCNLYGASYNILSVTPMFFLNFPLLFFTIFFSAITLILFSFTISRILFITVALILYYNVLYLPFFTLKFSIYNDQLGFAVETLYGYVTGYVAPYQGEYTTLGHAYFTTVLGKLLGLELYSVVKYEEATFVFISFLIYLSFAIKFTKKHVSDGNANLLTVATLLVFPSFALEPLVYSRGYFGLILGIVLYTCAFAFIENRKISDSIILTIIFVSSSISYPIQPLILVFSMFMFIFISWFLGLIKKNTTDLRLKSLVPKVLYFFVIWTSIQVFYGYGVWDVFHEIIFKVLQQEYFTAFETTIALKYVGDASVYVNLRIIMMASAWIISTFIALILLLKVLRLKVPSHVEQFTLSIMVTILLLSVTYGVAFHEPAMRFYRTLVAVIPFALLNIEMPSKRTGITEFNINRSALKKILMASLLLTLSIFLLLSPVIKWGWIFIGYPTTHDIALADYILLHYVPLYYDDIYPPGSHGLLKFCFESNKPLNGEIKPVLLNRWDIRFDPVRASSSSYTAIFYRIFLFPRWQGKNMDKELNEILIFSSQNNVLYNDFPWLIIGSC
ncbi:MAG: hypothetical protein QXL27_08565 [Candidatus Bathyarchaeia archaeon]